ncbi:hypothetical protein [Streptomyces longisporoflavus]|uniref:Uncharacterized protein n=1 Tax=Streptomyces longisporoflavus TaxID=28044 RepID=A0ABW7QZW1_9ACTN
MGGPVGEGCYPFLRNLVDFMGVTGSADAVVGGNDIGQAVFDVASELRPLVVLDQRGRPDVMVPQPVETAA